MDILKRMNKIILIITLIFSSNILLSQSILEIVTQNENFIVSAEKIKIGNYVNRVYFDDISGIIDENTFKEFKDEIISNEFKFEKKWSISDFKSKVYLLSENQKIDIDSIKYIIKKRNLNTSFLKQVKKFNRGDVFYKNFPLSLSDIIYNKLNNKALIVLIRGNNGGEIKYFELINRKWTFISNINNWAY